jgi:hypothetical protein
MWTSDTLADERSAEGEGTGSPSREQAADSRFSTRGYRSIVPIASAEEFVELRCSEDPAEYGRAAHDSATVAVWRDVIDPDMKRWVAHNKTVPLEILRVLAADPDAAVRSWVAAKRKLDRDLFVRLSADDDESVRHRLACNARVPREVLEALAADREPFVAATARERLKRTASSG